jgi:hypothetical protein
MSYVPSRYAPVRSPHKKNGLAHLQIFLLSWQPAYQLVLRPAHDLLGIPGGRDLQVTRVPGGPMLVSDASLASMCLASRKTSLSMFPLPLATPGREEGRAKPHDRLDTHEHENPRLSQRGFSYQIYRSTVYDALHQ